MADANIDDPLKLREIVLNTRKPLILKNFRHQWTCFEDGLIKWCEIYDKYSENKPKFERISIDGSEEPQWERKRNLKQMSAMDFLTEHTSKECTYWSGLNYKRKDELPEESTRGVDFGCFGFPEATDDCTFWLSSKGANTPCHYDTYGCNVVVQVFGRKSWFLLDPTACLTTTRIPYEESSVYCSENFYAPNINERSNLPKLKGQCYHCILEPNDVLIVPRHWWHFVEALEISLSVNTWITLAVDCDKQIEECIVKYLMERFLRNSTESQKNYVMNPNQLSAITSDDELFKVLEYLVKQKTVMESCTSKAKKEASCHQYQYLTEKDVNGLMTCSGSILKVPLMTESELKNYLTSNGVRYNQNKGDNENPAEKPLSHIQEALINSVCSPHVVELIKQDFFERYKAS